MIHVGDNSSAALCNLLPPKKTIVKCLKTLRYCTQFYSSLYLLDEMTKSEIDHFLTDPKKNAEEAPGMLGMIFANLAVGTQIGVFYHSGREWMSDVLQGSHNASECYRKPFHDPYMNKTV
jgi:hypothetical protein